MRLACQFCPHVIDKQQLFCLQLFHCNTHCKRQVTYYRQAAFMNLATHCSVYLLEQDSGTAEAIRSLCHEKSMELICFSSHFELLNALKADQPSCIIAANDQPDGQALNLMQDLASSNHQVPVIILGHHNDVSSAVAAIKAGAVDYIEKPTIYGRLAEQLNLVVKHSFQ